MVKWVHLTISFYFMYWNVRLNQSPLPITDRRPSQYTVLEAAREDMLFSWSIKRPNCNLLNQYTMGLEKKKKSSKSTKAEKVGKERSAVSENDKNVTSPEKLSAKKSKKNKKDKKDKTDKKDKNLDSTAEGERSTKSHKDATPDKKRKSSTDDSAQHSKKSKSDDTPGRLFVIKQGCALLSPVAHVLKPTNVLRWYHSTRSSKKAVLGRQNAWSQRQSNVRFWIHWEWTKIWGESTIWYGISTTMYFVGNLYAHCWNCADARPLTHATCLPVK